jgi:hypothetical protein
MARCVSSLQARVVGGVGIEAVFVQLPSATDAVVQQRVPADALGAAEPNRLLCDHTAALRGAHLHVSVADFNKLLGEEAAAIDVQRLPGDVARAGAGDKAHRGGDFVGCSPTLQ